MVERQSSPSQQPREASKQPLKSGQPLPEQARRAEAQPAAAGRPRTFRSYLEGLAAQGDVRAHEALARERASTRAAARRWAEAHPERWRELKRRNERARRERLKQQRAAE